MTSPYFSHPNTRSQSIPDERRRCAATHARKHLPSCYPRGAPGTALLGEGSWQTGILLKALCPSWAPLRLLRATARWKRPGPAFVTPAPQPPPALSIHPPHSARSATGTPNPAGPEPSPQSTCVCVRGRAALTCRLPAAPRRRLAAALPPCRRHPADGRRQAQAPDGAPGRPHASGAAPGQRGRRRTARLRHPPAAACCRRSPLRSAAALPGEGERRSARGGGRENPPPRVPARRRNRKNNSKKAEKKWWEQ